MRVVVCGAGIAGLALAWCLERHGHEVLVVERAPGLRRGDYMIDFFGAGYDAASRLGLLPELERIHYPVDRLVFVDGEGRERFALSYPQLRQRWFGGRHFNFPRGDLEALLHSRIQAKTSIRFGTTIEAIEPQPGSVRVRLSDGSAQEADLLVGADGVHSTIRRLAFAGTSAERYLGLSAAAFVLEHVPTGLRRANEFVMLGVPGREVALYPIRGDRLATFFLHHAPVRSAHSRADAVRELRRVYAGLGWIVPEVLDHLPAVADVYFDSVSQVELDHWSVGRVALVGDACQCVSLLAGQGASLALAGGYILAEEIGRAPSDVLAALARYERRLKTVIETKQAEGRRVAGWFAPETAFRLALRDLGLRASVWPVVSDLIRRRLASESVVAA